MAARRSAASKDLLGRALAVPLSVVLAAGCAPSAAFAGDALMGGEVNSQGALVAASQKLSAGAASPSTLYLAYLQVLFRAANGLDEFAESYHATDSAQWNPEYFLYDIGSDGTPELLVRTSLFSGSNLVRVYTEKSGKAVLLGSYWEWAGKTAGNGNGELFVAGWNQGSSYVNSVSIFGNTVSTNFVTSGRATESNPSGDVKAVNDYLEAKGAQWLSSSKASDSSLLSNAAKYSISKSSLTIASAGSYTGAAKTPAISVKFGQTTLTEGVDYKVAYANNVNAGIATVTVTGLGNYQGTRTAPFTIAKANVSAAAVSVASGGAYTGAAKTPAVTARVGTAALRQGVDYKVAYSNNVNAGTATATVIGLGNYQGMKAALFAISRANVSAAAVSVASGGAYTGAAKTPKVSVKVGGTTLKPGAAYKVTYKNNKAAGKATATVTGLGNYRGTKAVAFTIAKADNPMSAKAAGKTVGLASVAKAPQSYNAISFTKKAQGKVTYKNVSAAAVSKHVSVNASTGAVTVKKGASKGTYTVKVQVNAAGNANYKAASKTLSFKVTVK